MKSIIVVETYSSTLDAIDTALIVKNALKENSEIAKVHITVEEPKK